MSCIGSNRRKNKNAHELAEIIAAALIGAGVALFIYFHGRRPTLDVRRSVPEPARFKERIEIQNLGNTVYTYKVKVGGDYLELEKQDRKMLAATIPPGGAVGVILDKVADKLSTEDIVIECSGWLPVVKSKEVFRRKLEAIG